jgi:anaerobic magnesium-protoporphyrin IX monomethyl ester cyclase
MKVLLIVPYLEKKLYKNIQGVPIGLASLAAVLRNAQHDVKVFDATFSKDQREDIKEILSQSSPDVVGISVNTPLFRTALDMACLIKQWDRHIRIIFGGVHPTIAPGEVVREECVDYVVHGEGEMTVLELLEVIECSGEPKDVLGVAYKKGEEIIVNAPRPLIKDLDDLPFPAYDLFDLKKYNTPQVSKKPFAIMVTSRGCPYDCIFCDAHVIFGKQYRFHSPERVVSDMERLVKKFKVKEILFRDSEFSLDKERIRKLCELIIKKNINVKWICNGRIARFDQSLLNLMRKAGCRLVMFGVESGDQHVLDRLKKQITVEEIKETFRMTRKVGIKTQASFLIGSPGESRESLEKTINLAKEIKPDYCHFNFMIPYPGTELYRMARQNNWLPENFDFSNVFSDEPVMNATQLSTEELYHIYKKAFRSFYFRPSFIAKRFLTADSYEWKKNLYGFFHLLSFILGRNKDRENPGLKRLSQQ